MANETLLKPAPPEHQQSPLQSISMFMNPIWRFLLKQREASVLGIAIVLVIYFQVSNNAFLSVLNLGTLSQYTAPAAIIAAGEVMLLICGELDLSAGMVFALAPFVMFFVAQAGAPLWLGIIAGLLVSAVIGVFNGFVTIYLHVSSFITTLGTLFLIEGLTLIISGAFAKATPDENTTTFTPFAQIMGHGTYAEIIWAVIIIVMLQFILSRTPWGLHTIATGGNPLGASEVGVDTNRIKMISFITCSVLAGFTGTLESFRITSIDPLAGGTGIVFIAIAGSVIGGTALNGGSGSVIGALLGVLVISILQDGFTLVGVSANEFDLILGIAILVAMVLNARLQELRKAGRE